MVWVAFELGPNAEPSNWKSQKVHEMHVWNMVVGTAVGGCFAWADELPAGC